MRIAAFNSSAVLALGSNQAGSWDSSLVAGLKVWRQPPGQILTLLRPDLVNKMFGNQSITWKVRILSHRPD